jgi:hypothetical protein
MRKKRKEKKRTLLKKIQIKRTPQQEWQFWRVFNGPGSLYRAKGTLQTCKKSLTSKSLITELELYHIENALMSINKALVLWKENSSLLKPEK